MAFDPAELHTSRSMLPRPLLLAVRIIVLIVLDLSVLVEPGALFEHVNHFLNEILILDGLVGGVVPVVGTPLLEPFGRALDGVL